MKPVLNHTFSEEELSLITETKNGKKVLGKSHQKPYGGEGKTLFFLEDGSEIIEDDNGNILTEW